MRQIPIKEMVAWFDDRFEPNRPIAEVILTHNIIVVKPDRSLGVVTCEEKTTVKALVAPGFGHGTVGFQLGFPSFSDEDYLNFIKLIEGFSASKKENPHSRVLTAEVVDMETHTHVLRIVVDGCELSERVSVLTLSGPLEDAMAVIENE